MKKMFVLISYCNIIITYFLYSYSQMSRFDKYFKCSENQSDLWQINIKVNGCDMRLNGKIAYESSLG